MHGRLLNAQGATLIELVVAIVVVTIVITTLMLMTAQGIGRSVDPMLQEQASAVAQAYFEEIMQKGFCDPDFDVDADPATPLDCPAQCAASVCGSCRHSGAGTEAGRGLYDDVCDYDGLADAGAVDQTGTAVSGLGQYNVEVDIVDDAGVNLNGLSGSAGRAVRIDVTVTHPVMPDEVRLSGFRTNY